MKTRLTLLGVIAVLVAAGAVADVPFTESTADAVPGGLGRPLGPTAVATAADVLVCDGKAATIVGTSQPDILNGTGGDDVIVGLGGNDVIYAGRGNDTICGGYGHDVMVGGPGDDVVNGNAGNDQAGYGNAPGGVIVDLAAGAADGHGTDSLASIEHVVGSGHGDQIHGHDGNNWLRGGAGDDVIVGRGGTDRLQGGPGNDRVAGDAGDDAVVGHSGADILFGGAGFDRLYGGVGDDALYGGPHVDAAYGGPGVDACFAESTTACEPPPVTGITFAAAGDFGATPHTDATLTSVAESDAEFLLALGDLAYSDATEPEWCDYVKGHLGATFPVQLIVGNHEDDNGPDGDILNFAACLPDRMESEGGYAAEYFFDIDGLARVIMIGADTTVDGETHDYFPGTTHYQWLAATIDDARDRAIPWIIVGMHKVCITAGNKGCEVGADLYDLLLDKGVDLVLHGHDHNYQRSKQLTCAVPGTYVPACVADDGADGRYEKGAGLVFVVSGNGGVRNLYDIDVTDPEIEYLATWHGGNSPDAGHGYSLITLAADRLELRFIGSTTTYSDSFIID